MFIPQVCANLRDMCVVFAGPFPAGFSEKEVRRLFCCCGPVRKIKMLNTAVRVYLIYIMILYFTFDKLLMCGHNYCLSSCKSSFFPSFLTCFINLTYIWSPGSCRGRVQAAGGSYAGFKNSEWTQYAGAVHQGNSLPLFLLLSVTLFPLYCS